MNIAKFILRMACAFAVTVLAASAAPPNSSPERYQTPPARNDGWQTASADSVGFDSARLAALTQSIRNWPELGVHAILIERNGRLVYEEYFDGFDERWGQSIGRVSMTAETKHDLRSVTKSVVSALIGIAHGEGKIPSLSFAFARARDLIVAVNSDTDISGGIRVIPLPQV